MKYYSKLMHQIEHDANESKMLTTDTSIYLIVIKYFNFLRSRLLNCWITQTNYYQP